MTCAGGFSALSNQNDKVIVQDGVQYAERERERDIMM